LALRLLDFMVWGISQIIQYPILWDIRYMVAYAFYSRDEKGKTHFIGILPERRKDHERITKESILNWGRQVIESKDIFFIQVEIDEAQVKSWGLIPRPELKDRIEK